MSESRASGTSREWSGEEGVRRASLAESQRSDLLAKFFFLPHWEPVRRLHETGICNGIYKQLNALVHPLG